MEKCSKKHFGLGKQGRFQRAICGKREVCWSWSAAAAGCQDASGVTARYGAASLVPTHSPLLDGRAIPVFEN